MTTLAEWENFYVIVGSSAGALIGLQFVVLTLIADLPIARGAEQTSGAFTTPSVIHFGVVLLLSAVVSAPWSGLGAVAVLWGAVGLGGMIYTVIVARRMRAQTVYQPVFEDWLLLFWPAGTHCALPACCPCGQQIPVDVKLAARQHEPSLTGS